MRVELLVCASCSIIRAFSSVPMSKKLTPGFCGQERATCACFVVLTTEPGACCGATQGRPSRKLPGGECCLRGFCAQYDVDIVHGIEAEVGHQLAESTALEEAAVLKGITRVFAAKRAAALRNAEVGCCVLILRINCHRWPGNDSIVASVVRAPARSGIEGAP